jgi:FkbM family methyltransferase
MGVVRTVVERLSRGRVLRRRLPAEFNAATLYVSPDASLQFWKPGLRSDLFDFAREFVKPGSVVWDVGANVGLLALAAAQRAGPNGRVIAVEADMWLVGLLRRSAQAAGANAAPVEVLPAAASADNGIAEFHIAARGRASNSLASDGRSQAGGVRESVHVLTCTLDWLLDRRPAPTALKIDVEGAELDVLRGAGRLLRDARPVILCEVGEATQTGVTDALKSHGYTLYDWDHRALGPRDSAAWNTLALPPSR